MTFGLTCQNSSSSWVAFSAGGPVISCILRWTATLVLALSTVSLTAAIPTVSLTPGQSISSLRAAVRYKTVAPETAPGVKALTDVQPVRHSSTQFGQSGDTILGVLRFKNAGKQPGTWILSTGRGTVDQFELYRVTSGGIDPLLDYANTAQLGRTLDSYQAIATEVNLAPGQTITYLFKFQDRASSWMPLSIQSYADFFRERRANIALIAGVVMGSIILLLLNGLVFAVTGRREFLWLGAAELAFAANTFNAEGYSTIFFFYPWPEVAGMLGQILRTLFALLMMQFGRAMLDTRRTLPRFDRFLRAMVWFGGALLAAALAMLVIGGIPVMALHGFGWLYVVAGALVMPVIGWFGIRRSRIYWPLFIAWFSMAIYIAYSAVAISGLVPQLTVNWHWVGPIGLFECMMATLTLVLHLRQLYTDRVAAERDTRAALLEKLALSEETARLADDRARALADVHARDRLLEGSAHDTRHVLHALNSAVHFSKAAGGTGSPPSDLITLLEASAHHLEDIIASSVSIGNRDGRFLALGVSDPGATIEGLADIYAPIAQRDRIVLTVESSCAGKAILDEALFARLISNLLNNAIKFTESGTVALECTNDDGLLRLTLRDSGPGMSAQLAAWLNEHAGDTIAPDLAMRVGTGWRAIREIVALMQGSYMVETDASGTAVTVVLPNPASHGVHTLSLEELAGAEPGLRLCEIGALQRGAGAADGRVTVVIANDARAETRVASAAQSQLLLVRPLCREMLHHPYVRGLANIPAVRAFSTT
ncbi:sensor histidine kinase [Tsuneonella sp. YG55]|uniref:Sensor histidine kinase n=1 Tax=Tsuneonella litorea TaxID=2976475 RepID=A0A9X2W492_9SPHN|nr:sensor histidine kinase [Tsuneonella litorea]MCT2559361.1 sensor histidine kinase [Tsuneonella litorea]